MTENNFDMPTTAPTPSYDPLAAIRLDPPRYMGLGSEGTVVEAVTRYLNEWMRVSGIAVGNVSSHKNDFFGDQTKRHMEEFQTRHALAATGALDEATIRTMLARGFDYVETAKGHGVHPCMRRITKFANRKGGYVYWGPGIEPTNNLELARTRLRAAWPNG